ncbi:MAG: ExbD/TolR family protein [bacterium]
MFDDSRRFERNKQDGNNSGLTLAPMIDVVFLLLIFFMVSTTFITRPGLNLELPESESKTETPSEHWVISIDPKSQLYLNESKISLDDLQARLNNDQRPVLIRADRTVSHGLVVSVLDQVKSAGISSINISTEPITSPRNNSS